MNEIEEKLPVVGTHELTPCPFCGSINLYEDDQETFGKWVSIHCADCGCIAAETRKRGVENYQQRLAEQWNTRSKIRTKDHIRAIKTYWTERKYYRQMYDVACGEGSLNAFLRERIKLKLENLRSNTLLKNK